MSTRVCSLLKDRYLLTLVLADAAFAETLHETGHYVHYRLLVTSFLHVGRSVHRTAALNAGVVPRTCWSGWPLICRKVCAHLQKEVLQILAALSNEAVNLNIGDLLRRPGCETTSVNTSFGQGGAFMCQALRVIPTVSGSFTSHPDETAGFERVQIGRLFGPIKQQEHASDLNAFNSLGLNLPITVSTLPTD